MTEHAFLRGSPWYLKLGFAGFTIAALGVALTFADAADGPGLIGKVGFRIVVLGVSIGLAAILGGGVWLVYRALRSDGD